VDLIKPVPRIPIQIRVARNDERDFRFIDELHKKNAKGLGRWPRAQFEGYLKTGDVLIAEEADERVRGWEGEGVSVASDASSPPHPLTSSPAHPAPLGYIIGRDRYFKREDVGVIYQVVVNDCHQRALVGAMLVQAMFDRAAWGCKLFCCWCAQDLPANHFWESLGFVPLAFRTGSATPGSERTHIFWQKRIREGDAETPWWFPSLTNGGALRADRIVLPIPPGTHWSDAKPAVMPGVPGPARADDDVPMFVEEERDEEVGEEQAVTAARGTRVLKKKNQKEPNRQPGARVAKQPRMLSRGGLRGAKVAAEAAAKEAAEEAERIRREEAEKQAKKKRRSKAKKTTPKRKYHPRYIEAARELCARYLDALQSEDSANLIPESAGKYDIARAVEERGEPRDASSINPHRRLLTAGQREHSAEDGDVIDADVIEIRDAA